MNDGNGHSNTVIDGESAAAKSVRPLKTIESGYRSARYRSHLLKLRHHLGLQLTGMSGYGCST